MSVSFTFYDPAEDEEAFGRFVEATYGPTSFLHSSDYVHWWFGSSPSRSADRATDIVLAWHRGSIVGMNANIAAALTDGAGTSTMSWLANTMVLPTYRQLGLGVLLVKESLRHFPNVGSISFRVGAQRILEYLGFSLLGQMRRAVAIGEETAARRVRIVDPKIAMEVAEGRARAHRRRQESGGTVVELTDGVAAADLWRRVQLRYGLSTDRTADHVQWRYLGHPVGRYRVRGFFRDGLEGVIVARVDGDEVRALRIVDCFGMADGVAALLTDTLEWARERGCAIVDFFCTGCPDRAAFEDAGFVWLEEGQGGAIPFLFQPIDYERPYEEQVALRLADPADGRGYDDTYFTRGDSDRDRPAPVAAPVQR